MFWKWINVQQVWFDFFFYWILILFVMLAAPARLDYDFVFIQFINKFVVTFIFGKNCLINIKTHSEIRFRFCSILFCFGFLWLFISLFFCFSLLLPQILYGKMFLFCCLYELLIRFTLCSFPFFLFLFVCLSLHVFSLHATCLFLFN